MNNDTPQRESITETTESSAETAQRLEAIESRLAYQEHWLDTLDAAIAQQERRLMELERLSRMMQERMRELRSADSLGPAPGPEDELPPHY
uniref:SlyX family protein n=1 Tax=Halomonas sp. TaxID=1486246 RepID=UPI00260AC785|nr:SlyX family protein [Halomonas sp.]